MFNDIILIGIYISSIIVDEKDKTKSPQSLAIQGSEDFTHNADGGT